jgi:hypothetical protein
LQEPQPLPLRRWRCGVRRLIPGLLVLSLGIARASAADPVTLIFGSHWLYGDGSLVTMNLSGKGFGGGSAARGRFRAFFNGNGGESARFSRFSSTSPLSVGTGSSTVPGSSHVTAPVVVANPSAPSDPPTPSAPTAPGTHVAPPSALSGAVQLFTSTSQTNPLFTQDGNSQGTSSGAAQGVGKSGQGLTLTPAADPSPTPEPASLLLLGTGLAAAVTWQSRRSRRAA